MPRLFKKENMDPRRRAVVLVASAAAIVPSLAILLPRHSGLSGDFWIGGLIGLSSTLAIGAAILFLRSRSDCGLD